MSYPESFKLRIQSLLGEETSTFFSSLEGAAPTSIRLNPFKQSNAFASAEQIPWAVNGRYLSERPSFTFDPLFHAGAYYVQEASSMFLEQAWKAINPKNRTLKVLDLCAAPGGKSTHLLSLLSKDSLLVSNEVIPNRNHILQENIAKWGSANSIVTQNKPEDFTKLPGYFDLVVVDAPCSGEGLFRKDKNAIAEWSEKNVEMCSLRQKEILTHAVNCCAEGGFIIYSTCTYEPVENDLSVKFCLHNGYELFPLNNIHSGITLTEYGYQFFPHRIKGEGFFLSVLRKKTNPSPVVLDTKSRNFKTPPSYLEIGKNYLQNAEGFAVIERNGKLFAIPHNLINDFQFLGANLYIRQAGILLGSFKGKDFLPAHELAMSIHIKPNLPFVELNEEEAIAYLRCDNVKPQTIERGWVIARHKGFNLGWLKVMEGRANNYYPKEWRILKSAPAR